MKFACSSLVALMVALDDVTLPLDADRVAFVVSLTVKLVLAVLLLPSESYAVMLRLYWPVVRLVKNVAFSSTASVALIVKVEFRIVPEVTVVARLPFQLERL